MDLAERASARTVAIRDGAAVRLAAGVAEGRVPAVVVQDAALAVDRLDQFGVDAAAEEADDIAGTRVG
jgi:hypothetical protein